MPLKNLHARFRSNEGKKLVLQSIVSLVILVFFISSQNHPLTFAASELGNNSITPQRSSSYRIGLAEAPTPTATRQASLQSLAKISGSNPQLQSAPVIPEIIGRTPRSLTRDFSTVALFHFDALVGNTILDETGNYTGTINGNVSVVPGLFSNSLSLDGPSGPGSYVKTSSVGSLTSGTIEAYVDFASACTSPSDTFTILSLGGDFGSGVTVARLIQDLGRLNFEVLAADGWHVASSAINACRYLNVASGPAWPYETWRFHHVAGTWGPRGLEIWVDGVLHGITYPGMTSVFPNPSNVQYLEPTYACNPQAQLYGGSWPYCPSPKLGYINYNGVYTAGLSNYSQVLIGCDVDGAPINCFKGRIDDVRISNVQRTYDILIDPPPSPTPTPTPDLIAMPYTVDGNTLALYHLDSLNATGLAPDATGQHDARLMANAVLASTGRYNGSVSLDGNGSYVRTGSISVPHGTVETWVKLSSALHPFSIISGGDDIGGVGGYGLTLGWTPWGSHLMFGVNDGTYMHLADSGVLPSDLVGCWHFVAGTWGGKGVEIWVDGVKRGVDGYTGNLGVSLSTYLIGCNSHGECMLGKADEARISDVQRTFAFSRAPILRRAPTTQNFPIFLPLIFTSSGCPYG